METQKCFLEQALFNARFQYNVKFSNYKFLLDWTLIKRKQLNVFLNPRIAMESQEISVFHILQKGIGKCNYQQYILRLMADL